MKKRAAKTALILFEVIAILIGVVGAGAAFLYWRLDSGPVSLNIFKSSAQIAIERRLPVGYAVTINDVVLSRAEPRSEVIVNLSGLTIMDAVGVESARAENIAFLVDFGDVLLGKTGPKRIDASGAKFRIVRNNNQDIELPAVRRERRRSFFARLSPAFDRQVLKSAFERAEIANAEITFIDAASGRSWIAPAANVSLSRDEEGFSGGLDGYIDIGGERATLEASAHYTDESGTIAVVMSGSNFPVADILTTFYGETAGILDAPVTGKAIISFSTAGDVLGSSFSARTGEGVLRFRGAATPITFLEWDTQFDPARNEFTIERLAFDAGGSSGEINGSVAVTFGDDIRNPQSVVFDLKTQELVLAVEGRLPEALPLQSLALTGGYQVEKRRLSFNSIKSDFLDVGLNGNLAFIFPARGEDGVTPSPGVVADIMLDGAMDPHRLMRIWPIGVAMGARDWIEDRVAAATIENIHLVMDLPPGAIGEDAGMPDEAMALSFDVRDATAYFVKAMTPLTQGAGSGVVRGNSFMLKAPNARVGDVSITAGEVEFPVFIPKWEPTYIRFTATGKSEDLLGVIDQKPMSLLSKVQLSPDQFSGQARATVEIMRPNKRDAAPEEYRYSGAATFEKMSITDLIGDVELSDAEGTVDLKARSLTVKADGKLSDAPINIVWNKNFFEQDGPSDIAVAGVIDSSTGDLFGIPSRQMLRGPIAFSAHAIGELGAVEKLNIDADLSGAALTIDALGWRKPADIPADGDIQISFTPDAVSIDRIHIVGGGVEIDGKMSFAPGGVLQTVDIPRFFLAEAADLSLAAEREASGALAITATGDFLNGAAMAEQIVNGTATPANNDASFDWGQGVSLSARFDRMLMRREVEYRGASLEMRRDATQLQGLEFSAFDKTSAPLTISMTFTGADEGPQRIINARSGAIGGLLAGVFGVSSVSGGDGSMEISLPSANEPGFSGVLEARDLQVVEAPLLARIFSAGSLDGLANLLNGEGIDLSYAYGEFDFADKVLAFHNMRATGPSVGITAEGAMAVGPGGEVSLVGAVAPIYQLNSVLGKTPIIGDIFVGKKGEGILALSYSVSGDAAAPTVSVNPLSALTPGILRRLMQPDHDVIESGANDNVDEAGQSPPASVEN